MSTLQTEFQTYQSHLDSMLRKHSGQYVVIRGSQLEHFSDSYEKALEWAYDQFGLESFFVKKVAVDQDIAHFTRDLGPCRQ